MAEYVIRMKACQSDNQYVLMSSPQPDGTCYMRGIPEAHLATHFGSAAEAMSTLAGILNYEPPPTWEAVKLPPNMEAIRA